MTAPDLSVLAQAFLDAAVSALGVDAPAVRLLSPAPPALDCEMVAAWVSPVLPQTATPTGTTLARQYRFQAQVQAAWCWPIDNPTPAELLAAGTVNLQRGSTLLYGISAILNANGLPPQFGCSRYTLIRMDSFIAGGLTGWTLSYWLDS